MSNNHHGYHLKTNIETEGDLSVLVTTRGDEGAKMLPRVNCHDYYLRSQPSTLDDRSHSR